MHISILVPEGVLCTIGMSMWSAVFGFTQSAPCTLCQFMKSPHMHTGLAATLPWLVHHYVPTIHLPSTSSNSALHLHPHTCSEPGCTATFGRAHPSMVPIAWRNFHHKPPQLPPVILFVQYLLSAPHLRTPLPTVAHPFTPWCFTFSALVTLIRLSSDLRPPSSYHRQPSPSATGHSTHSGPLYNQPSWPPCSPSAFPVGLHNPHSHSRIWSGQVTSC